MAVENGVQNAELGYLLFPFEQYSNLAGKPLVGGHMEIFEAGTDTKYISYQNWDGAENPFKIPLPADGRITVLADPTKTFDCYLYDSYNNLVCSRLNVQCCIPGNISIKGADTILKNTDGTLDIYLRTLGNNVREYTVNTHNKILDVQEPLYFVENSNTATIIGFSGDNYATKDYLNDFVSSSISSKVDVSSFNEEITNITNNITALSADVDGKMDISKLEYNNDGEISAYDGSAFAGQGGAGDPEVNELVHSNSATWNDVSAKLDTTAFSTVSGNFLTAIPDDYATKDYVQSSVSSKLDSTAFSTVSGSFLTAHQDLSDYLTKVSADGLYYPLNSNPSGYLTAHQSLAGYLTKTSADTLYQPIGDYAPAGDYATHDDLTAYQTVEGMTAYQPSGNYADATALDGKVDTSSFTAFSSTTNEKIEYISGALSSTYELSAGDGIDITDYPNEQKTVISVTAQGGNPEVEQVVIANSATWDSVTGKADASALNDYATTSQLANKLDTTAFSTVSGNFLTAHQSLDGYATEQWVGEQGYLTTAYNPEFAYHDTAISSIDSSAIYDTSAHARINTLAGRISNLSSDKADTSALTAYQEITGMTAYQHAGSYLTADALDNVSANWNEVSAKLDTTAFSDVSGTFLTAHQDISNKLDTTAFSDVSGSFLTAVPDTYLQNTDLTIVDNKITEISGVPLSAGDELPSGVMNTSALEYNAVNEISGYNGSAIAQYGAEKQWLQHDDTLVHAANSAQYALGVNLSAVAQLLGIDETVLFFAGNDSSGYQTGNLSESIMNFKRIRVAGMDNDGHVDVKYIYPAWTKDADNLNNATNYEVLMYGALPYPPQNTVWEKWSRYSFSALTSFNIVVGYEGSYTANSVSNVTNAHKTSIREVVGIGRKS